jgi:DNA-binding IclR family transcriptional regulator
VANSRSGDSIITRVTRILESFDSTRITQTPSGVARRTGLPVSSAHRLMNELADNGFLERDDDGGFRIGMRLWELTTRGSNALGLRQVAMPYMEEVQAGIREHTQLGVLEQDEVLFIERLSARQAGANITKIAGRLPLNASSSGLVLLAYAPPDYQERILTSPLKRLAPETIVDATELRKKLAEVRKRGYAFAPGYIESVSTGIAVPVSDGSGVIAALSVVMPRGNEREPEVVARLKHAATNIGQAASAVRFASH